MTSETDPAACLQGHLHYMLGLLSYATNTAVFRACHEHNTKPSACLLLNHIMCLPNSASVAPFLPLSEILAACDLYVAHGLW